MPIRTIIATILFLASYNLTASELRQLTITDGLAGMTAIDVEEDHDGMLWIATSNGVSLFNGKTLRNYQLPRTAEGYANRCYDVEIDKEGNIWAGTKAGVFRLQRHGENFEQVAPQLDNIEAVTAVGEYMFVGNRSGLYRIDHSMKVMPVDFGGKIKANNSVRDICTDGDDALWFTTRNEVCRHDIKTGKTLHLTLEKPSGLSKLAKIGNTLYVGTKNNGLHLLDIKTGKATSVDGIGSVITSLDLCGTTLLVGTDGGGAYEMDTQSGKLTAHYGMDETGERHLPSNAVYTFGANRNGCRWFGMFHQGFAYQTMVYPLFVTYRCGDFDSRGIHVSAHCSHGDRRVICTTDGFHVVDETRKTATFHSTKQWNIQMVKHTIWHNNYFYFGSYDAGLLRYNELTGKLDRFPGCSKLSYATIGGMTLTPEGNLWITTSEGIFIIDNNDNVRNLTENNSKLPMGVKNTYFDANGNGWMGTMQGLCIYLHGEDLIKDSDFPRGFFNPMPNLKVCGKGNEIVAFNLNRIFRTNASMTDYGEIRLPEGVVDESCEDILPVGDNLYWIVSESGLFFWNDRSRQIAHYGAGAGLTGNRVCIHTLSIDDDQRLWAGTSDGLKSLNPNRTMASGKIVSSNVVANTVSVGSHSLTNGELLRVNDEKDIRVEWNFLTNRLVMTFAIPDLSPNDKKVYEYRLDYSDEWTILCDDKELTLSNLKLGTHHLEIRAAGFAKTATTFSIRVIPNLPFYIEALLVVIATVLLLTWRKWRKHTKVLLQEHSDTEQALIEEMEKATVRKEKENKEKYEKARIADKELESLFKRMDKYVAEKRPYLDKELKMSDIATVLNVSPSQLSQVFTLYVKEPYYDYINKYRLEEFKSLIAEGKHKQFTVAALSEQCGFKKTSFFSTFRKVEGMTPTEWIQRR